MKDCKKIHPLLPLYIEDALSTREKAAVEKHISTCPDAKTELKQLERLGKTLKNISEPKTPHDLHAKIMARVHGKPAPAAKPIWFRASWGLAAAAGLAMLFFIQNSSWFEHKNIPIVLKPSAPAAANAPSVEIAMKPQSSSLANQRITAKNVKLSKSLDPRLTVKSVVGVSHEVQPPSTTTNTEMVLAMAPEPKMSKKARAFKSNEGNLKPNSFSGLDINFKSNVVAAAPAASTATQNGSADSKSMDATELTPVYQMGSYEDLAGLNKNTASALSGKNKKLNILKFEPILQTGAQCKLSWETDLVTKGQVFVLDATGNTLQAQSETGQFAYDHQMSIDVSKVNSNFLIKLLVNDLNGNQAVTFSSTYKSSNP
jgi:hypothetical protein